MLWHIHIIDRPNPVSASVLCEVSYDVETPMDEKRDCCFPESGYADFDKCQSKVCQIGPLTN